MSVAIAIDIESDRRVIICPVLDAMVNCGHFELQDDGRVTFDVMRNALLASVLASLLCGVVGSFVVVKRLVFVSGGISHAAFAGVGLGYYLGMPPRLGALLVAALSADLLLEVEVLAIQTIQEPLTAQVAQNHRKELLPANPDR